MPVKRNIFFYASTSIIVLAAILVFFYVKKDFSWHSLKKEIEIKKIETDACQSSEDIQNNAMQADSLEQSEETQSKRAYPIHKDISVTLFWIGEDASDDNKEISNNSSAWDDSWVKHYGGTDNPKKRNGYLPDKFKPLENPFYFALPYNDFDKKGERRKDVASVIPWAKDMQLGDSTSYVKNRWIKITKGDKAVYAQWEDVGPFGENDVNYVFGSAEPASRTNKHAGLDVSPAVRDYLGISEKDIVDWQFIESNSVPEGPWKKVITKSNICWK